MLSIRSIPKKTDPCTQSFYVSSPNKLNATKKPKISTPVQPLAPFANNFFKGNPSPKYTSNTNTNFNPQTHFNFNTNNPSNYNQKEHFNNVNNFFSNPSRNTHRQPLIHSNGYDHQNEGQPHDYHKGKYCQNHSNKLADFVAEVDGGEISYCQKCAINLASKGFCVVRRDQLENSRKPSIFEQHKIEPFNQPQFANKHGYAQISKFMTQLDSVHSSYLSQIHKYQTIQSHYEHQYTITHQFYEQLLSTVQQMKSDHLSDLQKQAEKHAQQACIKQEQLKSDLKHLYVIRNDIMQSVGIILESFESAQFQMALNHYRVQINRLSSKIEEERSEFEQQIIDEKESHLSNRLKLIQQYLMNVWKNQEKQETGFQKVQNPKNFSQDKSPRTIKNLFNQQNGQRYGQGAPSAAYRKLFDDDSQNQCLESKQNPSDSNNYQFKQIASQNLGESITGQTSPQFKNI